MFPLTALKEPKNKEKLLEILKSDLCDNCLGRQFGMMGHGMTNAERGKILRNYVSELSKTKLQEPDNCVLCNNFFSEKIEDVTKSVLKKLEGLEFNTFLVGSIPANEMSKKQEELWERAGIEHVESLKSEINRELGKRIEKMTKKIFDLKLPDVTIVVDLKTDSVRTQIRSLLVAGSYQKLVRGIPQTKWICSNCMGKGCTVCKGEGKLYPTSIQEIIEKPLLKATESKKSSMHAAGREDIDARCLGHRPFVIELIKPLKRKIALKKLEKEINKSKKVKVKGLKIVDSKKQIEILKTERHDKTYSVEVDFENKIDKNLMKLVKTLTKQPIMQKTPTRVVHRRADIVRKRHVKAISYKLLGSKKARFIVKTDAGLYVKELIHGDEGRTEPNISEMIGNKVKSLKLDVIRIHK